MLLNKKIRNNSGFTLMEILTVMIIFSFLLGGLYSSLYAGEASWEANRVRIELQQELRKAMEGMIFDLRQAGDTSITDVPPVSDGSWLPTITFKTPSGISNGNLVWNVNTIQYVVNGTNPKQLQKISNGNTKVLAQYIKTLQFRRQTTSSDTLEVAMVAEKNTVKGKTITVSLDFDVNLRN